MKRTNRIRWRHKRDTLPARRRGRRRHRRDRGIGSEYTPMKIDPRSALRGVRSRLMGAMGAASMTLICMLYALATSIGSFGATFAFTTGLCSFAAAVALLLSARHEEEVHQLASDFARADLLEVEDEPAASVATAQLAAGQAVVDRKAMAAVDGDV